MFINCVCAHVQEPQQGGWRLLRAFLLPFPWSLTTLLLSPLDPFPEPPAKLPELPRKPSPPACSETLPLPQTNPTTPAPKPSIPPMLEGACLLPLTPCLTSVKVQKLK